MKHGRMYRIYCYTNKITGKKYVGQTCLTLEERAGKDGCKYTSYDSVFSNAIKKYGWDNFVGEILEDGLTLEEANEREEHWIRELDTLVPNGYNLQTGGKHCKMAEETHQKLSEALKGRTFTDEHKRKISEARTGFKFSEESKHKMSVARKGKKLSESHRLHVIEALKGRKVSEETKKRLSESNRGQKRSKETCELLKEITPKKVTLQYSLKGELIAEYKSAKEASIKTGLHQGSISNCCLGRQNTAGGFIWKYKEAV